MSTRGAATGETTERPRTISRLRLTTQRRERWTLPPSPAIATAPVLGLSTGGLFTACGLLVIITTMTGSVGLHSDRLTAIGSAAVALGVLVLLVHRRMPRWTFHLTELTGTVAVGVGLLQVNSPAAAVSYAFLFVLLVVEAFFFFSWPLAALHTALIVSVVVTVLDGGYGRSQIDVTVIVGALMGTAAVVGWLVRATAEADVDVLTGLPNRRGAQRLLDASLARAERTGSPLGFAVIDLDHFKDLNDTHGHAAGDRLLRVISRAWAAMLPPSAVLARWGGDEFVLALPGADGAAAAQLVDVMREQLPPGQTISAGTSDAEPGESASMLLSRADAALYTAKRTARGTTHRHTDTVTADTRTLSAAVQRGEVEVHYQPVVSLADASTVGAEALVRWRHPQRGLLAPAHFLAQAEVSGAIIDIGDLVLRRACAEAASWPRLGDSTRRRVNVNASGVELATPGYVQRVAEALSAAGLPPEALLLEITEGVVDLDAPEVRATLAGLTELEVRLAIDDFGTGYSSLTRLARLDVSVLKIDRSFITPVPASFEGTRLVKAILGMADTLGLEVVAEGVETTAQAAWLHEAGCAKGQGYLWARPLTAPDFTAWLSPHTSASAMTS